MQKDKDKRRMKRDALKSFLESSTTPVNSEISKSEVNFEVESRLTNEPVQ